MTKPSELLALVRVSHCCSLNTYFNQNRIYVNTYKEFDSGFLSGFTGRYKYTAKTGTTNWTKISRNKLLIYIQVGEKIHVHITNNIQCLYVSVRCSVDYKQIDLMRRNYGQIASEIKLHLWVIWTHRNDAYNIIYEIFRSSVAYTFQGYHYLQLCE